MSRTANADSMASSFAPDATLFEPGILPTTGRPAIRALFASFPGVRVDSATATPDVLEFFGDTAYVCGAYFERLAFPGQPASEQSGRFVMEWVRQPDGRWLIQRLFRVPVSTELFGIEDTPR
jgi:uncharacterized protein (TIGR02246 family)